MTRTDYTYVCLLPTDALASTTAPRCPHHRGCYHHCRPPLSAPPAAPNHLRRQRARNVPTVLGEGSVRCDFYSPYTAGGECKTKQEGSQGLKVIKNKGFNLIRVYSTDCSGLRFHR